MENLSEAEWPSWTSKKQELLIDGLTVTQVFSNVHVQLETLRKRKFANKAGVLFEDELSSLADQIVKLGNAGTDRIPQMEMKMKVFERRLDSLDDSAACKSDLAKLEIKLAGRMEGLEKRISSVETSLAGFGVQGLIVPRTDVVIDGSINGRLELLESKIQGMSNNSMTLEKNLESLINQFSDLKKQLESLPKKVSDLGDNCSVNECKIGGLENLFSDLHTGYSRVKIVMERLPEECYERVKGEIYSMEERKAEKTEMIKKAELSQLHLKADLSEVSLVNDLCNQLDKRLEINKIEVNDSLKSLRSNYDKRLEALLQWILKQLRRLAGNTRKGSDLGGTDIGKVKCLVCDQVVSQHVATDTVFGGPAMPVSLKTLTQNRPMPFENESDRSKTPKNGASMTQPWGRTGQNRSPSPPRTLPHSGSAHNLDPTTDRGLDRILQGMQGPATNHRPISAQLHRSDSERGGGINVTLSQSADSYPPNICDAQTVTGDRKLSQFKELEL